MRRTGSDEASRFLPGVAVEIWQPQDEESHGIEPSDAPVWSERAGALLQVFAEHPDGLTLAALRNVIRERRWLRIRQQFVTPTDTDRRVRWKKVEETLMWLWNDGRVERMPDGTFIARMGPWAV